MHFEAHLKTSCLQHLGRIKKWSNQAIKILIFFLFLYFTAYIHSNQTENGQRKQGEGLWGSSKVRNQLQTSVLGTNHVRSIKFTAIPLTTPLVPEINVFCFPTRCAYNPKTKDTHLLNLLAEVSESVVHNKNSCERERCYHFKIKAKKQIMLH